MLMRTNKRRLPLSDLYQEKENNPYILFLFHTISGPSYLSHCRGSKLALLHRVKERETPSLSTLASFAPFSLKVAWSGKSLISHGDKYILRRKSQPYLGPGSVDQEDAAMNIIP